MKNRDYDHESDQCFFWHESPVSWIRSTSCLNSALEDESNIIGRGWDEKKQHFQPLVSPNIKKRSWSVHLRINLLDVWIANITAAPSVKRLKCRGNLVLKMVEKFVFHVIIVPGHENLQSTKFWSWLVTSASNTNKETEGPMIMKQTPAKSQPDEDYRSNDTYHDIFFLF